MALWRKTINLLPIKYKYIRSLLLALLMLFISFTVVRSEKELMPKDIRLKYNNPNQVVDLGVGLWANPIPVDWDSDGDNDLLVTSRDKPSRGMYYFENTGKNIFLSGKKIADGIKNLSVSWQGDKLTVCSPETVYKDFKKVIFQKPEKIPYKQDFFSGRANQWKYADYNGDSVFDLLVGVSDWRDYGWDDAYNKQGEWIHGKLHGFVYYIINTGTNKKPVYAKAQKLYAGDLPVDVYGKPSPNLVDWDQDGDLDLICGEFLDKITFFENIGSRSKPKYAQGKFLKANGKILKLELEMPEVVVYDWDSDNDPDILVGMEDGRVVYIENKGKGMDKKPVLAEPVYFKQKADYVKCGVLSTPAIYDWDNDGDLDIISGNSAGFIEYFENLGGKGDPVWAGPKRLKYNNGKNVFRIMAGKNGSIQGPAEEKWGYTVPVVADWNMDGLPDIILNSITGKVEWLENIGTKSKPRLGKLRSVTVDWPGEPPKPKWNWWNPKKGELVVQWRTRPIIIDLNKDGWNDLILIDHEGYLSYFERKKMNGKLILKPGKRIFYDEKGNPLLLNHKKAGKSGRRKIEMVDWDNDGDLDLLVNTKNVALFENIGDNGEFIYKDRGDLTNLILAGHSTCPVVTDWNNDGVSDLLIGAEDGFFYYLPRNSWNEMLNSKK